MPSSFYILLFIGFLLVAFIFYLIFKQIGFFINATRLYRKMIRQQKLIVGLLIDIRDNTKIINKNNLNLNSDESDSLIMSDKNNFTDLDSISSKDISILKDKLGTDAITYAKSDGISWLCVCGTKNPIKNLNCSNCHRNMNNTLKNYSYDAFHPAK